MIDSDRQFFSRTVFHLLQTKIHVYKETTISPLALIKFIIALEISFYLQSNCKMMFLAMMLAKT